MTAADHGTPLELHPDRLFPVDPTVRAIARELYDVVRELPLICPHGHVDPRRLAFDQPFENPTSLLVTSDHYVTRLLHASGIPLDELGVGDEALSEDRARSIWRLFCGHWDVYRGTAVRYWLECQLVELFGVAVRPSAETADAIYDRILECLGEDAFRPRALYARFGVEVLATTDDPCDDLGAHEVLVDDPSWTGRVIPTFRPDRYLEAGQPGWPGAIAELAEASGIDTGDYAGYIDALEQRRQHFIAHGATAADHGHADARTDPLDLADAKRIYRAALAGKATAAEAVAFRRHMVLEMARMSCDDGLVMTLHPGVVRGHHPPTADRFGADAGHDIPVALELTNALASAPRALRHDARIPPRRLHRRRDGVVTRARPARGLLPVGVRRCAVVVPRRARRDQAVPGRDRRDRRLLAHRGLRRRHACLLHDPGPARHVEAHRRRRARPARRRAPPATR